MKKIITSLPVGLFLIFAALSFATEQSIQKDDKPNIIFIMADDLGYGHLGCYGQEKIQTPNIDKMAGEGMLFTEFYAGNCVCAPSRCSLITGKHPGNAAIRGNYEIGVWDSYLGQLPLPENETTMFDIVKQVGYATATYGKWGVGRAESTGAPDRNGVDDFFGYNCQRHAHTYYPRYLEGNRGEKIWLEGNNREDGGKHYSHDLVMDKAMSFIKANKNNPFLLYLPLTIPHSPMQVPDLGIYRDRDWGQRSVTEAAMISLMDKDVGRIMTLLKELGIDEKSIVFFTSDNGSRGEGSLEAFNSAGPLRGKKTDLYEGGLRIPMIARWPGRIEAGRTSAYIGALWDMMPTFADLVGNDRPLENTDGISFVPELLGKPQAEHECLYWEFHSTDYDWAPNLKTKRSRFKSQALRMGPWKAIRHNLVRTFKDDLVEFSPIELYNLKEDISETTNVAKQYPDRVRKMRALMKASHTPSVHFPFRSN
ncbi:arylsulfatase [Planctomycetota bacterium]